MMEVTPLTSKLYLRIIRIIHGAMIAGIVLFNLVIAFLVSEENLEKGYNKEYEAFFLVAGVMVLLSIFGGKYIYTKELSKAKGLPLLKDKLMAYQTANIIRYALIEGTALFTTVLTLITLTAWFFVVTAILVLVFVSFFPSTDRIIKELELNYGDQTIIQNKDSKIGE